jgi:hypothetical protein
MSELKLKLRPPKGVAVAVMLLELAHEERFLLAALVRNDNERQKTERSLPHRF